MSCNYCSFSRIKEDAQKSGQAVTLVPHKMDVDVFVHPRTIKISKKDREEKMPNHKYWVGWFMELPDECDCGGAGPPIKPKQR